MLHLLSISATAAPSLEVALDGTTLHMRNTAGAPLQLDGIALVDPRGWTVQPTTVSYLSPGGVVDLVLEAGGGEVPGAVLVRTVDGVVVVRPGGDPPLADADQAYAGAALHAVVRWTRHCRDSQQPVVVGSLVVAASVGSTGDIRQAWLRSTPFRAGTVEQCVLDEMRAHRLPPTHQQTERIVDLSLALGYPLEFASDGRTLHLRNVGPDPVVVSGIDVVNGPGWAAPLGAVMRLRAEEELAVPLVVGPGTDAELLVRTSIGVLVVPAVPIIAGPAAVPPDVPHGTDSDGVPQPASVGPVLGSLERSSVDDVIKADMYGIRLCYQRELAKHPTLGGKLVVHFVIASDGSVPSSDVKSTTFRRGTVEQCVVDRFRGLTFPPPKGGGIVIVSYPFLFCPGTGAPKDSGCRR